MKLFKRLRNRKLSEKDKRWNLFVDEVCEKEINDFNGIKKDAAICFWYDNEMNNGGDSSFFDWWPEIDKDEVYNTLMKISNKKIADNYMNAVKNGEKDNYEKTDDKFYEFDPSLSDYLMKFVEDNKDKLFK